MNKKLSTTSLFVCAIIGTSTSPIHMNDEHFSFKKTAATLLVAGASGAVAGFSVMQVYDTNQHQQLALPAVLVSSAIFLRASASFKKELEKFTRENNAFLRML